MAKCYDKHDICFDQTQHGLVASGQGNQNDARGGLLDRGQNNRHAMSRRHPLLLPDLGMGATPVLTSLWLVKTGSEVSLGDRLLEVTSGVVCVDLPSPVSGVLVEQLVSEDQVVTAGQPLAWVEESADESVPSPTGP